MTSRGPLSRPLRYGRHRLPRLLAGWRVVGAYGYDASGADLDRDTTGGGGAFASGHEHQPVFVVEPEG